MAIAAVLGKEALIGLKVETAAAEGTAVACGAGNQQDCIEGVKISAKFDNKVDDDGLHPTHRHTWQEPINRVVEVPVLPKYQGLEELVGLTMGGITAPAIQTNPLAYAIECITDDLSRAGTFIGGEGKGRSAASDILEVVECAGCRGAEMSIEQSDLGRPKMSFKLVPKDISYSSSTNTTTSILDLTYQDASFPVNVLTFDHLRRGALWLAHQDSDTFAAADQVGANSFKLTYDPGLLQDIKDNYDASGTALPIDANKRKLSLSLGFLRNNDTTQAFRALIRNNALLKALIHYESDKGIPGCSISNSSPSTDISGGTDTKLNFTITHVESSTAEDVEITLTLAGLNSGANIAAAIQAAFRAKTATSKLIQKALDKCTCTYNTTVTGKYYLSNGSNDLYTWVNKAASEKDLKEELKLGTAQSGIEPAQVPFQMLVLIPEIVFKDADKEFKLGAPGITFEGFAMTSYGASYPVGFSSGTSYLQSNMSSELFRLIFVNRRSASPFA